MSILDCYGQDRVIERLQLARQVGRVAHSMIFHGGQGVGKALLARQWAKLQLCASPVRRPWRAGGGGPEGSEVSGGGALAEIDDCCDQCEECHLVDSGTHPDFHVIDRALGRHTSVKRSRQLIDLPIDVIREFVIDQAGVYPSRGRAKVFLIDQAETMNRAAQNALLKTLEEPPANMFLVLIASSPERLLSTVRSRCQSVQFASLPSAFVAEKLAGAGVGASEAAYWSDFCQGRLGLALELAGASLYGPKCELVEKLACLGYDSALDVAEWLVATGKGFSESYVKANPESSAGEVTRQGYGYLLALLADAFRGSLRVAGGVGTARGGAGVDQAKEIGRLAVKYGALESSRAIRATWQAERMLSANVNATLLFESLMIDYLDCAVA